MINISKTFSLLWTFLFIVSGAVFAADSHTVSNGGTETIDEHSVCRQITNNHSSGASIMVPTKTANEWHTGGSSFLENKPSGVTEAACASGCAGGGVDVGGHCWHLGSPGQSCSTVCSNAGLVADMVATRDYAGSGGSNANCQAVLNALSVPGGVSSGTDTNGGLGCWMATEAANVIFWNTRSTNNTTASASFSNFQDEYIAAFRACACQSSGGTTWNQVCFANSGAPWQCNDWPSGPNCGWSITAGQGTSCSPGGSICWSGTPAADDIVYECQ